MTDLKNINDAIMFLNESDLLHVILCGNASFDNNMNISILTATIKFIKDTEWFNQSLFKLFLKAFLFLHSYPLFFKTFVVLQLGFSSFFSPYCLQMISKVSFLNCFVLYIYIHSFLS